MMLSFYNLYDIIYLEVVGYATKTMQNGKTASYTYNGDGLRMSKTVDSIITNHIWRRVI